MKSQDKKVKSLMTQKNGKRWMSVIFKTLFTMKQAKKMKKEISQWEQVVEHNPKRLMNYPNGQVEDKRCQNYLMK